jgi:hypothetical protein
MNVTNRARKKERSGKGGKEKEKQKEGGKNIKTYLCDDKLLFSSLDSNQMPAEYRTEFGTKLPLIYTFI